MEEINKVIKRLDLIKTLIALEEEDDIIEQIIKLNKFKSNEDIQKIIALLQQKSYNNSMIAIEAFLSKHNRLVVYTDPEFEALRFEAKALEKQIQERSDEKAELDKLIHEFNVRHNQELGQLIIRLLKYRKEQSKGTPQHEKAEKDYNEFYSDYEAGKKEVITILTEEEQIELKNKYRKASKLCHPDLVKDEQKEAANKIFVELTSAYQKSDLKRVSEILDLLKRGSAFTLKTDSANEKQVFLKELERLRQKLNALIDAITNIKTSHTFITINGLGNWVDIPLILTT